MKYFGIQFLISNIYIIFFIIFIITIKRLLNKYISVNFQYYLWFILFVLLIIPFTDIKINNNNFFHSLSSSKVLTLQNTTIINHNHIINQVYDFAVSSNQQSLEIINKCIIIIWTVGILIITIYYINSWRKIIQIKKEAKVIKNNKIISIYQECLTKLKTRKDIPIYYTTQLKSPVLIGILYPRIYLPTYFTNQLEDKDLRYILLHELQHYHHKDILINYLINISSIFYWFNPFIWLAVREMRLDREIACDYSVLKLLDKDEYLDYGHTLIKSIENISLSPFLSSISTQMKQTKRRIITITKFNKDSIVKKIQSLFILMIVIFVALQVLPILSTNAYYDSSNYDFLKDKEVLNLDLSSIYDEYNGSFVLYDSNNNIWHIYNEEMAIQRISPYSTYKIYAALFGLESNIIHPKNSKINWNKQEYPFDEWEQDQDLDTAMKYSVNWYFQMIDNAAGYKQIQNYIQNIEYGNQKISYDINNYWMDDSLKISPIEQVQLLQKLNQNNFIFSKENINAVKQSIHISINNTTSLYGKTGTGRIEEKDINGWFIGFIETYDNIYYFATNIQNEDNANGSKAYALTLSILSYLNILK